MESANGGELLSANPAPRVSRGTFLPHIYLIPGQNVPFPAKICLTNAMHIVKGKAWALFKTIVCQYVFPVFP